MTTPALSAQTVAQFLQENPDFFTTHADVFATLVVPHPHQTRAISLGERQVMTLRDKVRDLEWRLTELVRQAERNESISKHLKAWCQRILAESDLQRLPDTIAQGLNEQFDLQGATLRVWSLDTITPAGDDTVNDEVRTYAHNLKKPYCGNDTALAAAAWLAETPASLAIIALRTQADAPAFGLLVLGSSDPKRFTPDMSTDFLDHIGQLASAALSRSA